MNEAWRHSAKLSRPVIGRFESTLWIFSRCPCRLGYSALANSGTPLGGIGQPARCGKLFICLRLKHQGEVCTKFPGTVAEYTKMEKRIELEMRGRPAEEVRHFIQNHVLVTVLCCSTGRPVPGTEDMCTCRCRSEPHLLRKLTFIGRFFTVFEQY